MAPLLIYGYFSATYSDLNWDVRTGIVSTGILRSFAGLCIGGSLYVLAEKLSIICVKPWQRVLFTMFETGFYIFAVLFAWKYPECDNSVFLSVFCMFSGLCITFSNLSYSKLLDIRFFGLLGRFAMPLYICHYSVGKVVFMYTADRLDVPQRYLLYFSLSVLCAAMMRCVVWAGSKK